MKLSILILTVPSRIDTFYPRIVKSVLNQIKDRKNIEVLALLDNKKRTVGEKRQSLINISKGEYIVFIDDDDRISEDYIDSIMKELESNPEVDCVVFDSICDQENNKTIYCKYGIEYEYITIKGRTGSENEIERMDQWRGKPAHTMVYKAKIAKSHCYSNLNNGEDMDWVKRAWLDVKNQVRINKVLYYYDARYETTSETAGLPDSVIKFNINKNIIL